MELIDTHCHIQSAGLESGERNTRELWSKAGELSGDQLVQNAEAVGVSRMICVGCDLDDSKLAIDFVQSRSNCSASIGIHPHEAQLYNGQEQLLNEFARLATSPKVVAIGECGLDFYYSHSPKEDQIAVLKFQIELAIHNGLPLIFHIRDAFDDFWPIFEQYKGIRGVIHSFTDSIENLERAVAAGLYVGVNGIATFTKNEAQLSMYKAIPLTKLLLETDAPFLTPTPYRGSINEPKNIQVVCEFLSGLRDENPEQLAVATTSNACALFGL